MLSSDLIDVIIGVVFAWFLLSLVVSALNESFAWATKSRAKLLWRGLGQLFSDGVQAADARLRSIVVELPRGSDDMRPTATTEPSALSRHVNPAAPDADEDDGPGAKLRDLYDYIRRRVPDTAPGGRRTRISHVPAAIVSDGLETLAASTVTRASLQAAAKDHPSLSASFDELPDGPLDRDVVLAQVPEASRGDAGRIWDEATRLVTFDDLEDVIRGNPALLARVRAATAAVGEDERVVKAREEIERWFESSMDALSRFYRRQNRKIVAMIALPIVLLANADAFDLVERLRQDQDLRAASATAASTWATEPLLEGDTGGLDLDAVCARATEVGADGGSSGEAGEAADAGSEPGAAEPDAVQEARRRYRCAGELFASSDLIGPLGPRALWREIRAADDGGTATDLAVWTYEGLLGRLVTWVALLLGASFWYDALRRLIGLKGKIASAGSG